MIITYDFGEEDYNWFEFEPTTEELINALAIAMIKEEKAEPTEYLVMVVSSIINTTSLYSEDDILDYYRELIKEILEPKALEQFRNIG